MKIDFIVKWWCMCASYIKCKCICIVWQSPTNTYPEVCIQAHHCVMYAVLFIFQFCFFLFILLRWKCVCNASAIGLAALLFDFIYFCHSYQAYSSTAAFNAIFDINYISIECLTCTVNTVTYIHIYPYGVQRIEHWVYRMKQSNSNVMKRRVGVRWLQSSPFIWSWSSQSPE